MGKTFLWEVNYPRLKEGACTRTTPRGEFRYQSVDRDFYIVSRKVGIRFTKYPTTFLVLRKARFRLATEYQYIKEPYNINSSKVKKLKDKQAGGAIPPPT